MRSLEVDGRRAQGRVRADPALRHTYSAFLSLGYAEGEYSCGPTGTFSTRGSPASAK